MAYLLEVHIVDAGDQTIKVTHQFWGVNQRECLTYKREHLGSCEYFKAAEQEGRTIEELIEIGEDELPDPEDFEDEGEEEDLSA